MCNSVYVLQERVLLLAFQECHRALLRCTNQPSHSAPTDHYMCKHILHTRPYKVSHEPVSIHLPITRLLAGEFPHRGNLTVETDPLLVWQLHVFSEVLHNCKNEIVSILNTFTVIAEFFIQLHFFCGCRSLRALVSHRSCQVPPWLCGYCKLSVNWHIGYFYLGIHNKPTTSHILHTMLANIMFEALYGVGVQDRLVLGVCMCILYLAI